MTTGTPAGNPAEPADDVGDAGDGPHELASICWCCGAERPDSDLVRLGAHPEVGVCTNCAVFLHRRARATQASGASRQLYAVGERARDAVMARGWHELPRLGPALQWVNRHLPW